MLKFFSFIFLIPIALGLVVSFSCAGPERQCGQMGAGAVFVFGMIGLAIFLLTERDA